MNTQNVVEYLFELALKQDIDTRETLAEMDKVFNQALATARAEALRETAERRWISVKDRLPDGFKWYLVVNQAGKIFLAMYSVANKSWLDNNSLLRDPTHWMPLPERPAILADKQEPQGPAHHNSLFGYPVVVDPSIPESRLIIMTPAVFDDLKKRLEPMMPYKQEGKNG